MLNILKKHFADWHRLNPVAREDNKNRIRSKYQKTLCIMFSDIAEFSHKTRVLGDLDFLGQLQLVHSISDKYASMHNGRIIRTVGDNLFFAFQDPLSALKTAINIQNELASYNAKVGRDIEKIKVCFGISSGSCLDFGVEIYGDCVNIASKLAEDIAEEEDILVEKDTLLLIRDKLEGHVYKEISRSISGITINYCIIEKQ